MIEPFASGPGCLSIAFNNATQLPVILPISMGGELARRIGFAVPLAGTKITAVARCGQPRVMDIHARDARQVDSLPVEILSDVLAKALALFRPWRRAATSRAASDSHGPQLWRLNVFWRVPSTTKRHMQSFPPRSRPCRLWVCGKTVQKCGNVGCRN